MARSGYLAIARLLNWILQNANYIIKAPKSLHWNGLLLSYYLMYPAVAVLEHTGFNFCHQYEGCIKQAFSGSTEA
jgi:hypothetical protein